MKSRTGAKRCAVVVLLTAASSPQAQQFAWHFVVDVVNNVAANLVVKLIEYVN